MPGTATYLNHVPSWVILNDVLLGFTNDGDISVNMNQEWVSQFTTQTGANEVQAYNKGGTPTISVDLAEVYNWDNWIAAFPNAEKQVDTDTPVNNRIAGHDAAGTAQYVGQKATTVALQLVIRPVTDYTDETTETGNDFFFPLTYCANVGDIPFGLDTPLSLSLEFRALFNPAASLGQYQWVYGLETEGAGAWVAA